MHKHKITFGIAPLLYVSPPAPPPPSISCGDGQMSDVQTTLEEYLSHSAWKGTGTTMGIAAVV